MKHFKTFRQFRQHIVCIFAAFAFVVAGCGGGADDGIYLEQAGSTQMDSMGDSGDGDAFGAGENAGSDSGAGDSDSGTGTGESGAGDDAGSKGSASGTGSGGSGGAESSGASDDTSAGDDAGSKSDADAGESSGQDGGDSLLFVYVCGAVARPGVYELPAGGRVFEAVELAGGMTEDAGLSGVNQAEQVSDGQMIYIPTQQEIDDGTSGQAQTAQGAAQGAEAEAGGGAPGGDGLIDLNTATQEQLMTLSGIGEAKAKSILDYREEHGGFSSPEEVMQVEGIKEGLYNRIKDDIKVS